MSRIRGKGTGIERMVFGDLRKAKIHFRPHYALAPGRPDAAVPSRKLAVFVHGDFWHGWRYSEKSTKLPAGFWREKIVRNRERDRKNMGKLRRMGWKVLCVWEHELKKSEEKTLKRVREFLGKKVEVPEILWQAQDDGKGDCRVARTPRNDREKREDSGAWALDVSRVTEKRKTGSTGPDATSG